MANGAGSPGGGHADPAVSRACMARPPFLDTVTHSCLTTKQANRYRIEKGPGSRAWSLRGPSRSGPGHCFFQGKSLPVDSESNKVGEYLRGLRQARGLTTRQVGIAADCTDATVSRIERGERRPSIFLLWKLIEVLDGNFLKAYSLLARDAGVPEEICSTISSGIPSSAQSADKA